MILDDFADLTRQRVPTPAEFLGFVHGMGWRVVRRDDGSPAIRAPKGDPVAPALARMLSREPYRTGVLGLAMAGWRETPPPPPPRLREWAWPVRPTGLNGRLEHGRIVAEDATFCSVGDLAQHPSGALWWRWAGEEKWSPIPGRGYAYDLAHGKPVAFDPDEDAA